MAETSSYAAFISYSHAGDSVFAERLQREVERFAKRWNKIRAVRLFRDDTNLTASPGLWTSIVTALDASRWLVLLASPETAASHWCGREVAHWLEAHGSTDRILLVLTAGTLVWDDALGGFDPARSTALPPALAAAFAEEPLWVDATWTRDSGTYDAADPRMQRATVDVAAAIRELSKDELVGTAVKEHRRATMVKRSAQGTLSLLLVLSIIASFVALQQRHTAIEQRREAQAQTKLAQKQTRLAQARELAALSTPLLSTNVAGASTLAVAAFQKDADAATRSALIRATQASPHLVGSYDVGADVTATPLAASPSAFVMGLRTGAVVVWRSATSAVTPVLTLPTAVTDVAQDPGGDVVVASDGAQVSIAADGTSFPVTMPAGMLVHTVAVTPDGRYVWVRGNVASRSTYVGFDLTTRKATVRSDDLPMDKEVDFDSMVAPSDDHLVLFDYGHGLWARISARDGRIESRGHSGSFGNHTTVTAMSPTGRFLAATQNNGAKSVQVWSSTLRSSDPDPLLGAAEATADTGFTVTMAVSPSGGRVAVADDTAIYVSQTTIDPDLDPSQGLASLTRTTLDGAGGADQNDGVRFLDDTHLASVSSGVLTIWDLGQADRLGVTRPISLESGCNACPSPGAALSDDGRVLSVNSSGTAAALTSSDGRTSPLPGLDFGSDYGYATPLWDANQSIFVVPVTTLAEPTEPPQQSPGVRVWPLASHDSAPSLASTITADDHVVSVVGDGRVYVQQASDGAAIDSFSTGSDAPTSAGVSPDGRTVAVVSDGAARVYDVATHQRLPDIATGPIDSVALTDKDLLAGTLAGGLTMWNTSSGARERRFSADPGYFARPAVVSPDGSLLARSRTDLKVDLVETATGRTVATLGNPGLEVDGKLIAAFSPDSLTVATLLVDSGIDTLLDLRDLSTRHLVDVVCASAVKQLDESKWERFAGDAAYSPPDCPEK